MTENTMADLRREVASRLRDTLHGREIDTMERGTPELPHMLGVVELGAISTHKVEAGTILDPNHEFWGSYYRDINTKNAVTDEITTAMHSLREDDIFRVTEPYGENSGILYVEVDDIEIDPTYLATVCAECGAKVTTEPDIQHTHGSYALVFVIDCAECDFERTIGDRLPRFR